jgi:isopenicillin-N epimerase
MSPSLREEFLLDPNVVFLNHGSFGATPRPVFEEYQTWQARMERQPVQFLATELAGHLAEAREVLGKYVNAAADDLVYVPNATFAVNAVARSLDLGPGDEVLTTNHEYGACGNVWRFLSIARGFSVVTQDIPLGLSRAEMAERLWGGVSPRTRVIFMSHITSPTALRLPVEVICARARAAGILTLIDAAHAVGQIPLDLAALDADFYTSNAHKWLCAPKGSAFLYARRESQRLLEPLVVGWGWGEDRALTFGSDFLDAFQWPGTDDFSAYLSVPAAIRYQEERDWPAVRRACRLLVGVALARIGRLTGLPGIYADDDYCQLAVAPLPPIADLSAFKRRLYDDYRVEIPCIQWGELQFIRISIQAYNDQTDVDALEIALQALLPGST